MISARLSSSALSFPAQRLRAETLLKSTVSPPSKQGIFVFFTLATAHNQKQKQQFFSYFPT
jgi:hypothetical protein